MATTTDRQPPPWRWFVYRTHLPQFDHARPLHLPWVAQPWTARTKTHRGRSLAPPLRFRTHAEALAYAVRGG